MSRENVSRDLAADASAASSSSYESTPLSKAALVARLPLNSRNFASASASTRALIKALSRRQRIARELRGSIYQRSLPQNRELPRVSVSSKESLDVSFSPDLDVALREPPVLVITAADGREVLRIERRE